MPSVCLAESLVVNDDGELQLAPWTVPRNVVDVLAHSGGDTPALGEVITLPGRLLIDKQIQWTNDSPVDHQLRVEVTRRWKRWVTSNPNAIQFRDRWSSAITAKDITFVTPEIPVVSGIFNSKTGSAGDVSTNTVAEPNPGKFWHWWGTNTQEEWIYPVLRPGETFALWYRAYVWTPPPFSNNANKNAPAHEVEAGWTRITLHAIPEQGKLVVG